MQRIFRVLRKKCGKNAPPAPINDTASARMMASCAAASAFALLDRRKNKNGGT